MPTDLSFYINKIERDFQTQLEVIRIRNLKVKQKFLNHDLSTARKDLTRRVDPDPKFLDIIYHYYRLLCFETDPEVQKRFIYWGIPKPTLKWMIPLEKIIEEINIIDKNKKMIFFKHIVLSSITVHLEIKIRYEIISWARKLTKFKLDINQHKQFSIFFRRLDEGNGKIKRIKHVGEELMEKQIHELDIAAGTRKESKKFFLSIAKGNSAEISLKQIIEGYFEVQKISESERLLCMSNLLKLICRDKHWLTQQQFQEKVILNKKKGIESTYFDGIYELYLINSIKKYIYKV